MAMGMGLDGFHPETSEEVRKDSKVTRESAKSMGRSQLGNWVSMTIASPSRFGSDGAEGFAGPPGKQAISRWPAISVPRLVDSGTFAHAIGKITLECFFSRTAKKASGFGAS